jgi:hypothetical protein
MKVVVESLVKRKHEGMVVKVGDAGQTMEFYIEKQEKNIPVWFFKHQREFYWKPVWMKLEDVKIIMIK